VHVFYVGQNGTVLGMYTTPPFSTTGGWTNLWFPSPVSALNLAVSDAMFVRSCAATDSYLYPQSPADMYLYYGAANGTIQKWAMWSNSTQGPTWQALTDLPPIQSARGLACDIANGIETLWVVNEAGFVEQWWRGKNSTWTKGGIRPPRCFQPRPACLAKADVHGSGFVGSDQAFANSSLLTVHALAQNMTHLFFQDTALNVRRYDITGYAQDTRLDGVSTSYSATAGTRLASMPNSDYCQDGECVTVVFQRFNTSDLHYTSFSDECTEPGAECAGTSNARPSDSIVPLAQTYGVVVKRVHLSGGAIAGVVIGCVAVLALLGFAARKKWPRTKPKFGNRAHFMMRPRS
jgi:hypothetical protein